MLLTKSVALAVTMKGPLAPASQVIFQTVEFVGAGGVKVALPRVVSLMETFTLTIPTPSLAVPLMLNGTELLPIAWKAIGEEIVTLVSVLAK